MTMQAVRLHESVIDQILEMRKVGSVKRATSNPDQAAEGGPRRALVGRSAEVKVGAGIQNRVLTKV